MGDGLTSALQHVSSFITHSSTHDVLVPSLNVQLQHVARMLVSCEFLIAVAKSCKLSHACTEGSRRLVGE